MVRSRAPAVHFPAAAPASAREAQEDCVPVQPARHAAARAPEQVPGEATVRHVQGRSAFGLSGWIDKAQAASDVAIVRIANQLRPEGFTVFSVAPSVVMDREAFRAKGVSLEHCRPSLTR